MFTTKEIWEAGRAALGLAPTATTSSAAAAPAVAPAADNAPSVFDPSKFQFQACVYRIHFKNGNSGEYDGAALSTAFPFDVSEIESIEPSEDVGQDL